MHAIDISAFRRTAGALVALAAILSTPAPARAENPGGLSDAQARRVVDAAVAEARRLGAPGAAIAVVDAGGFPIAVERLDGTFVAGTTIATGKARTAALFGRPTKVLENAINSGRVAMTALVGVVGATPMQGGVPLAVDGRVLGAVGVAGAASADQDTEIAEAAAKALSDPAPLGAATISHFTASEVAAAFAAGKPLTESAGLKVHASRRTQAGEAEVHTLDTDVFYLLDGEAVIVLGGTVTSPREVTPTEIRGAAIEGGERHPLRKGDVLVIPAGTPHWFQEIVQGPVLYYTVKATGAAR